MYKYRKTGPYDSIGIAIAETRQNWQSKQHVFAFLQLLLSKLGFVDYSGICVGGLGRVRETCLEDFWAGFWDMFGTLLEE